MSDDTRPSAANWDGDAQRRETWRDAEFEQLVKDIEVRLRNACAHLPADDFTKLVRDIARVRARFDAMDPLDRGPKPPPLEQTPP